MMRLALLVALLSSLVAGCGEDDDASGIARPRVGFPDGGVALGPPSTDLPCEVAQLLATQCWTCHGAIPSAGAPMALVTAADLARPSALDPSASYAERSVVRMRAAMLPMPPAGARAPDADIAALEAWITAGSAAGTCEVRGPYDTPTMCTSGRRWVFGNLESEDMRPGGECIACHTSMREGPRFSFAGTLYPSAHEPDDCVGSEVGEEAVIEITGADGDVIEMRPNRSGNFFSTSFVALPYTVRVLYMGRERVMATAQTSGDCNACHTVEGAMGAPGRVIVP